MHYAYLAVKYASAALAGVLLASAAHAATYDGPVQTYGEPIQKLGLSATPRQSTGFKYQVTGCHPIINARGNVQIVCPPTGQPR
jgi:hypothetical protein